MSTRRWSGLAFVGLVALLAASGAHAQVYRCIDPATGKVTFSDTLCPATTEGERITVRPNTLDTSGGREQALRREVQELRDQVREYRDDAMAPRYGRTQPDLQAERIDSRACEQAKRSYDVAAASKSASKETVEAARSAMYGACGMREPDRVEVKVQNVLGRGARVWSRSGQSSITRCDDRGCWDNNGDRYWLRDDKESYMGPSGICRIRRGRLDCP